MNPGPSPTPSLAVGAFTVHPPVAYSVNLAQVWPLAHHGTASTAHIVTVVAYSFCVAVVITAIVTLGWVALSENPGRRVQAWKSHRVRTACLFAVVILVIWGALLIRVATN